MKFWALCQKFADACWNCVRNVQLYVGKLQFFVQLAFLICDWWTKLCIALWATTKKWTLTNQILKYFNELYLWYFVIAEDIISYLWDCWFSLSQGAVKSRELKWNITTVRNLTAELRRHFVTLNAFLCGFTVLDLLTVLWWLLFITRLLPNHILKTIPHTTVWWFNPLWASLGKMVTFAENERISSSTQW